MHNNVFFLLFRVASLPPAIVQNGAIKITSIYTHTHNDMDWIDPVSIMKNINQRQMGFIKAFELTQNPFIAIQLNEEDGKLTENTIRGKMKKEKGKKMKNG